VKETGVLVEGGSVCLGAVPFVSLPSFFLFFTIPSSCSLVKFVCFEIQLVVCFVYFGKVFQGEQFGRPELRLHLQAPLGNEASRRTCAPRGVFSLAIRPSSDHHSLEYDLQCGRQRHISTVPGQAGYL
jgi:hypothetical protein